MKRFQNFVKLSGLTFLFVFPFALLAQHSISIRATPLSMDKAVINDSSPLGLEGSRSSAFNGGVEYQYNFKSGFGLASGIHIGYTTFYHKFGNQAAARISNFGFSSGYLYNTFSVSSSYSFKIRGLTFRAHGGPGLRYYQNGDARISLGQGADTKSWSKGEYNPTKTLTSVGEDALLVNFSSPNDRTQFEVNAGLSIEKAISKCSILVFGIRKNWGLQPMADGDLDVRINNQLYKGKYDIYSNYFGLDFAFKYNLLPPPTKTVRENKETAKYSNSRKSVFGEFLGNSPGISVNYDQRFKSDSNGGLGFRVGVGVGRFDSFTPSVPVALNYILGDGRNGLEAGIGITPKIAFNKSDDESTLEAQGFLNLGYRFQPLRDGFMFRLTYTPTFNAEGLHMGWAGVSIGHTFK